MEVEALLTLACVATGIVCARAWAARTAHLKISLFRPYRGDPWPIGVQEDDDARWNWTPVPATAKAAALDDSGSLETVSDGSVSVDRVGKITVRASSRN
jgi:hypothetical protein